MPSRSSRSSGSRWMRGWPAWFASASSTSPWKGSRLRFLPMTTRLPARNRAGRVPQTRPRGRPSKKASSSKPWTPMAPAFSRFHETRTRRRESGRFTRCGSTAWVRARRCRFARRSPTPFRPARSTPLARLDRGCLTNPATPRSPAPSRSHVRISASSAAFPERFRRAGPSAARSIASMSQAKRRRRTSPSG